MFGFSHRISPSIRISLHQKEVQFVNCLRCLDVIIDSELSLNYHIDKLAGKIWTTLSRLYVSNMYLPPHVKL